MQPNLFTVILRAAQATPSICTFVDLDGITAIILAAKPCDTAEIFPMDWRDNTRNARQIEDAATQGCLATARADKQGFDVERLGEGPAPKWTDEVIRALDFTARAQRTAKRARREAERCHALAQARHKDHAYLADRAREASRHLPSHAHGDPAFRLDARARLTTA